MSEQTLFPLPDLEHETARPAVRRKPRVQRANRAQIELRPISLERLLPEDHQARAIWAYVESLDLSAIYAKIKAVEGHRGRSPIDPKILMALWLYATVDGVGSARAVNRLCSEHLAYMWIRGCVGVNYHALADFRTAHAEVLDAVLTEGVAVLCHEGLVEIKRMSQDGMRVRASAGAASFRRGDSLKKCLTEAKERVDQLRREVDENPAATSKRQASARKRAAEERASRVEKALALLPKARAKKKRAEKDKARVSTTDPEANVMKMPDGGFRPAYNVQFGADTKSQVILGVDVGNVGSDKGELAPMVEQVTQRYGVPPEEVLVDGGFVNFEHIERVSSPPFEAVVFAPPQRTRGSTHDPHEPRPSDSPVIAEWRARMATDPGKTVYKERGPTSECVNAIARNRGLRQFLVRGLEKVKSVALWFAIAHNMMRTFKLRAAARAELAAA